VNTNGNIPPHPRDDLEIERLLRAVESDGSVEVEAVAAMGRDRAALRSALRVDLASPLPAHRAAQFSQAVRDEIDRGLLADLSRGVPLQDHLPVSMAKPTRRTSREAWASGAGSWRVSRALAVAATLSLVAVVAWLAMLRPSSPGGTLASSTPNGPGGPRELPSWATLPPLMPNTNLPAIASGQGPTSTPGADAALEPTFTRDAATALAWAKRGVLAVRITTDSPRRDRERLDTFAQISSSAARWTLSTSTPSGIVAVPVRPWPINTGLADSRDSGFAANAQPETAALASFGLSLRPTTDALESARADLEGSLAGTVIFERVDALAAFAERPQPEPAPDSAADVLWWRKPVSQWSPRLRVPVLVEFGVPDRGPAVQPGK
jgi:hypothetical protein